MTRPHRRRTRYALLAFGLLLLLASGFWISNRGLQREITTTVPAPDPVLETTVPQPTKSDHWDQRIASSDPAEFDGLLRSLLLLENGDERTRMLSLLMQRWLKEDADSFTVFLNEAELNGFELWDRLAPGMAAALREMSGDLTKTKAMSQIIERILVRSAESDPENALAWAREFLSDKPLDATLAAIAPSLATVDPEAAIDLLDEVQSFPNQMQAANGVGIALGKGDFPLAMTWAESFYSETERTFAISGVLQGMATRDSTRAAGEYHRVVEQMKNRFREQVLADRVLTGGTVDEEYEGLSPEEIEKAELAKPNPNLVYFENAARVIALELADEDPLAALRWAKSMDLYQGRAVAMETIYETWSEVAPEAALQSLMQEEERRPELAGKVFTSWATDNPRAAATTVLTLEPGLERDTAIEGVAIGWMESGASPSQLATWAEELKAEPAVERVRAVIAAEAAYENPVLAWKQVEQIRNPMKRSELFQEVFPNLVEENPKLARRALSTIQLSPVEIEYFQAMLAP